MTKALACQENVFENSKVRTVFHNGELFFSIVDVIRVLTESPRPRQYWDDLKRDILREEGFELSAQSVRLKLPAEDGKLRLTECGTIDTIYEIMMEVRSKKTRPFKRWIAKLGAEHTKSNLGVKSKFPKQPRTADRVQATIATKSLNDVIISKLSQAPDKIFLHVEEKIHKAITRMTASYHKKKMNGNNGIDLLCFHERSALVYAKEALILELEKHKDFSLTRAEIRALTDSVCNDCRQLVGFFESKNVLNKVRYMDILPAVEQKTLLLSVA